MWNRRLPSARATSSRSWSRACAARIPRLRLLRRRRAPGRRPAARAQHRARGRAAPPRSPPTASQAAPASPTRAGPRTARRLVHNAHPHFSHGPGARRRQRRGVGLAAAAGSRWCTTASSRTTTSCAPSCRPRATCSPARPTPRSSPTWSTTCTTATCSRRCSAPLPRLRGAYAIAVFCRDEPHRVVGARQGSPLVLGVGHATGATRTSSPPTRWRWPASPTRSSTSKKATSSTCSSASTGSATSTRRATSARVAARGAAPCIAHSGAAELGPYRHYMQKEIFEQPRAIADTLDARGRHLARAVRRRRLPRLQGDRLGADPGLRHQLLQRLGRQVLARDHRQDPDPGRGRQRIPLPRQRAEPAHAGGHDHRRAARPPTRWPR